MYFENAIFQPSKMKLSRNVNKTNKRMENWFDFLVKRKEDQRTKHGGGKM